ncbi:MAG: DUF1189 family protein, partial [Microgenomates group bacterium]
MKKVKTFLHIFEKSLIPSISYYKKIIYTRFLFSFRYFCFLIFLLSLTLSIFLAINNNPVKIKNFLKSINNSLINFPADLEIKIRNGRLISSYPYPYFHWIDSHRKLLLVIDETAETEKINIYNSYFLLTQNELIINFKKFNKNLNNYVLPLSIFNAAEFSKENLNQITKKFTFFVNNFYLFYFLFYAFFLIILFIASFLTTLFYLIIASLIVYLIFKFYIKRTIHFKKVVQISFHAVTLPLLIDYLPFIFLPGLKLTIFQKLPFIFLPLTLASLITIFNFAGTYFAYLNGKNK